MPDIVNDLDHLRERVVAHARRDLTARRHRRRRAARIATAASGAVVAMASTAIAADQLGVIHLSGTEARPLAAGEPLPPYARDDAWHEVADGLVCGAGRARVILPGRRTDIPATVVPPLEARKRLSPELAGCREATAAEVARLNRAGAAGTLGRYRIDGDDEVLAGLPIE